MKEQSKSCPKCNSLNTYYREIHADTGMDEMELNCRDCDSAIPKLPLSFRVKEKLSIFWHKAWGASVIRFSVRLMRWAVKQTYGYCHSCGCDPGFSGSYSRKGYFCDYCRERYFGKNG